MAGRFSGKPALVAGGTGALGRAVSLWVPSPGRTALWGWIQSSSTGCSRSICVPGMRVITRGRAVKLTEGGEAIVNIARGGRRLITPQEQRLTTRRRLPP